MNITINKRALGLATLILAGAVCSQTTSYGQSTTTYSPTPSTPSLSTDNVGVLGQSYADLHYSWVNFRGGDVDANGFIAGFEGNTPVARGVDVGLGYNYYRENNHRDPFNGSPFDVRFHQVATHATFFSPMRGMKPFVTGLLGYQWARGDLQSFRTFGHEWIWGASVGAEIPLGAFALTPRISYTDTMHSNSVGSWHYGAEAHHWFTEKVGGYLDATFHEPRGSRGGPDRWTYTAGFRVRF
ncbi:MAG: hypothetical protein ABIZ49_14200 [Opitutaceae bacterium]